MHATAFLKSIDEQDLGPMVVLHGSERSLKVSAMQALCEFVAGNEEEAEACTSRFSGRDADLTTILDDLRTVSMWGDGRIVIVDEADPFVSAHRAGLEKYLSQPAKKSLLILDVKSWPKNTRLAKVLKKVGTDVECSELKGATLFGWIQQEAKQSFSKQISRDSAMLLAELAGSSCGLLQQELEKLATYTGERATIGPDDVRTLVGGWKAETTWAMIDATRDGNLSAAYVALEKLLNSGEAPQRILGAIHFAFRKFAQATERARQGEPLGQALRNSGVFPRDLDRASNYLRRVGRPKAEKLLETLVAADAGMKGGSRLSERLQLERLLLDLSGGERVRKSA